MIVINLLRVQKIIYHFNPLFFSFTIILNYLRLKTAGQLWEACLPKDPDRLALLTQEAEYFR